MTTHPTLLDLRAEGFETIRQLEATVKDAVGYHAGLHPHLRIEGVFISLDQNKRLRFERYLQGVPVNIVKKDFLQNISGLPVMVSNYESGCPNCGSAVHWQ